MTVSLSFTYFMGLVIFAVAMGSYVNSAPIGFMIIGGGLLVYTITVGMLCYLRVK